MGKDAYLYQITKMVFPTELTHNQQTKPLYIGLDGGASSGILQPADQACLVLWA